MKLFQRDLLVLHTIVANPFGLTTREVADLVASKRYWWVHTIIDRLSVAKMIEHRGKSSKWFISDLGWSHYVKLVLTKASSNESTANTL